MTASSVSLLILDLGGNCTKYIEIDVILVFFGSKNTLNQELPFFEVVFIKTFLSVK